MISLFFWFLLCVVLSAFFSAAEMAFVSSDRVRMREKADSGDRAAKRIVKLYKSSNLYLTTILIGNNVANIVGTVLMMLFFTERLGIQNEWLVTAIMTPLLLVFAEIIPKDYARLFSETFLIASSAVLIWLARFTRPFTAALLKTVDFFLKPLGGGAESKNIFVSEQEFRSILEEGTRTGIVTQHEKKIIDTILDFEKMRVGDVMTPVDRVPKVEIHDRIRDVKKISRETGAKMLLVYEEIPSIVVGMIYVFDVLFEEENAKGLNSYLRSPIFIRETTSNETAFFTLQQRRQSYAVVVDDKQEVTGVVAIERLLAI